MHTKKLFSDSKYYGSVLKVQEFMVNDIQKTLSLKETPNFLLVLGLCCYTEYWGKLRLGVEVKEQKSEKSFNVFICGYLDPNYYPQLRKNGVDIYKDVRCGLAHSYLIEKTSNIDAENDGSHGIVYDSANMRYTFYVKTYFQEFKSGVNRYINGLIAGTESVEILERCLDGRPVLV
jgi:hypothetical protein